MTTDRDFKAALHETLLTRVGEARRWNTIAAANPEGPAAKVAEDANKALLDFTVETYIPHGGYERQSGSLEGVNQKFATSIAAIGKILDEHSGLPEKAFDSRNAVMHGVAKMGLSTAGFYETRLLNSHLTGAHTASGKAWSAKSRDFKPVQHFNNDTVTALMGHMGDLNASVADYIEGKSIAVAGKAENVASLDIKQPEELPLSALSVEEKLVGRTNASARVGVVNGNLPQGAGHNLRSLRSRAPNSDRVPAERLRPAVVSSGRTSVKRPAPIDEMPEAGAKRRATGEGRAARDERARDGAGIV